MDCVREDIHHPDAIEEADHDLETGWVERHTHGIVLELLIYLKVEAEGRAVAPYFDGAIRGASCDEVLFDADIHAGDWPRVEGVNEVLVHGVNILRVMQVD